MKIPGELIKIEKRWQRDSSKLAVAAENFVQSSGVVS
jgi:hypothetical protein